MNQGEGTFSEVGMLGCFGELCLGRDFAVLYSAGEDGPSQGRSFNSRTGSLLCRVNLRCMTRLIADQILAASLIRKVSSCLHCRIRILPPNEQGKVARATGRSESETSAR